MNWSFKKKPKDELVVSVREKTALFTRKPQSGTVVQDVDVIEVKDISDVVSVMADEYPEREAHVFEQPRSFDDFVSQSEDGPSHVEMMGMPETVREAPDAEPAPVKVKKPLWSKGPKAEKSAKVAKAPKGPKASSSAHHADGPRPLKVLIGFLPDSSEKDTYFYMLGVAEKNLDSENIGYASLMKFENGFAYEIHEGGAGRGYLESILSHFRSLPSFAAEETHRAFIRTATRTVRVERTPTGLYSVILPESDATPQSEWLTTGKKLSPLVEKRTGLFLAGVVLFLSGLVALMGGYATRYQPYTPSVVNIERVPVDKLPHSQWSRLTSIQPGDYVMALKFEKNEWLVQTPSNPTGKVGGAKSVSPSSPAAKNAPTASPSSPALKNVPAAGAPQPAAAAPQPATAAPIGGLVPPQLP